MNNDRGFATSPLPIFSPRHLSWQQTFDSRLSSIDFVVRSDRPKALRAALYPVDRERFEIIDQARGLPLKSTEIVEEAPDGSIGEKLCVIFPALVRKGSDNGRDIVLVKATILAALHGPVIRRRTRKPIPSEETAQSLAEASTSFV
jgi:hypothetical protein